MIVGYWDFLFGWEVIGIDECAFEILLESNLFFYCAGCAGMVWCCAFVSAWVCGAGAAGSVLVTGRFLVFIVVG